MGYEPTQAIYNELPIEDFNYYHNRGYAPGNNISNYWEGQKNSPAVLVEKQRDDVMEMVLPNIGHMNVYGVSTILLRRFPNTWRFTGRS